MFTLREPAGAIRLRTVSISYVESGIGGRGWGRHFVLRGPAPRRGMEYPSPDQGALSEIWNSFCLLMLVYDTLFQVPHV